MNKDALNYHFSKIGMYEGRLYKRNQKNKLPEYLEKYLNNIGFKIN